MNHNQESTTPEKPPRKRARKKTARPQSWLSRHILGVSIAAVGVAAALVTTLAFAVIPHSSAREGGDWIYIPKGSNAEAVRDSLKSSLGSSMGMRVYLVWKLAGGDLSKANGAYLVRDGQTALTTARRIATGRQTPVRVTFNGVRRFEQMASRIASQLECDSAQFVNACYDILPSKGFVKATFPAAFIPDSYEFYWSAAPDNVVYRLLDYRNRFWTEDRLAKARKLGLSKVEVATLASIIEEETAKRDERPKIARLYLNRLEEGMRLQADPTVKFAVGDFSLRRILGAHLKTVSPYNTYLNPGLPPGPIRIPEASSLDAVLDAPPHHFLYMCAKEDFSGYHNFAADYSTHQANARRYQAELNRRKIK